MGVGLAGKTRANPRSEEIPGRRSPRPYGGPCGAQPGHPPERGSRGRSGLSAAAACSGRSGQCCGHRGPETSRGAAHKGARRPPHCGPEPPGLRAPRRAPLRRGSSPPPLSTGRLRLQREASAPLRNRRWLRSSMGRRGGCAGAGCRGGEGERSRAPAARGCPAAEPQGDALQRGFSELPAPRPDAGTLSGLGNGDRCPSASVTARQEDTAEMPASPPAAAV